MPGEFIQNTVVGMPVKCITAGEPTPSAERIAARFENEKLTMDPANQRLLWEVSKRETQKYVDFHRGYSTEWRKSINPAAIKSSL